MKLERRVKYIKNMQPYKGKNKKNYEEGFYITRSQLETALSIFKKYKVENKKVLIKKPLN